MSRRSRIWRDCFTGLVFTLFLSLTGFWLENTEIGQLIEQSAYTWLQHRMEAKGDLPVTVVNISELGTESGITPREPILSLIESIAEQGPQGIGIDIDFSPSGGRYVSAVDPLLFRTFLSYRQREVPVYIYVGVSRSATLGSEKWLGSTEFKTLAAALAVPHDATHLYEWIRSGALSERLPTMSGAMTTAGGNTERAERWPERLGWIFEKVGDRELLGGTELSVGEFAVDYSPLLELEKDTIQIEERSFQDRNSLNAIMGSQREKIRGKLVMVGDATLEKSDRFPVPGQRGRSVAGVFMHACGIYTLANAPLYEFRSRIRPVIDSVLAMIMLALITAVRRHYDPIVETNVNEQRLHAALIAVTVFITFVFAAFVQNTRVIWDGFVFVSLMLVFHPFAEKRSERLLEFLRHAVPQWWRRLLFERGK